MAETVEELKARKAWLLRQVDACDRAIEKLLTKAAPPPRSPKPTAQDLPGVPPKPPRQPNDHEVNHGEFQAARKERFARLGIDYVPDEPNTAAFVVVTMKRLRDACRDDDELWALIDAYVHDRWAASLTPPFPLKALGSQKTYGRLLEQIRPNDPAPVQG